MPDDIASLLDELSKLTDSLSNNVQTTLKTWHSSPADRNLRLQIRSALKSSKPSLNAAQRAFLLFLNFSEFLKLNMKERRYQDNFAENEDLKDALGKYAPDSMFACLEKDQLRNVSVSVEALKNIESNAFKTAFPETSFGMLLKAIGLWNYGHFSEAMPAFFRVFDLAATQADEATQVAIKLTQIVIATLKNFASPPEHIVRCQLKLINYYSRPERANYAAAHEIIEKILLSKHVAEVCPYYQDQALIIRASMWTDAQGIFPAAPEKAMQSLALKADESADVAVSYANILAKHAGRANKVYNAEAAADFLCEKCDKFKEKPNALEKIIASIHKFAQVKEDIQATNNETSNPIICKKLGDALIKISRVHDAMKYYELAWNSLQQKNPQMGEDQIENENVIQALARQLSKMHAAVGFTLFQEERYVEAQSSFEQARKYGTHFGEPQKYSLQVGKCQYVLGKQALTANKKLECWQAAAQQGFYPVYFDLIQMLINTPTAKMDVDNIRKQLEQYYELLLTAAVKYKDYTRFCKAMDDLKARHLSVNFPQIFAQVNLVNLIQAFAFAKTQPLDLKTQKLDLKARQIDVIGRIGLFIFRSEKTLELDADRIIALLRGLRFKLEDVPLIANKLDKNNPQTPAFITLVMESIIDALKITKDNEVALAKIEKFISETKVVLNARLERKIQFLKEDLQVLSAGTSFTFFGNPLKELAEKNIFANIRLWQASTNKSEIKVYQARIIQLLKKNSEIISYYTYLANSGDLNAKEILQYIAYCKPEDGNNSKALNLDFVQLESTTEPTAAIATQPPSAPNATDEEIVESLSPQPSAPLENSEVVQSPQVGVSSFSPGFRDQSTGDSQVGLGYAAVANALEKTTADNVVNPTPTLPAVSAVSVLLANLPESQQFSVLVETVNLQAGQVATLTQKLADKDQELAVKDAKIENMEARLSALTQMFEQQRAMLMKLMGENPQSPLASVGSENSSFQP